MSIAEVVLASASLSRRAMLEAAGVTFTTAVAPIDEKKLKQELAETGAEAGEMADALAEAKALAVSALHPRALVVGADQVLVCEGRIFDKCKDAAEARETLEALRGREHELLSAAVIAAGTETMWRHGESARLRMRTFSDAFLEEYLSVELPEALGSVGVYRIEGRGAQLFEQVEGDQFCIRGLPLLAVLGALRRLGGLRT